MNVYVPNETRVQLATLEKGHFFGEMSCLTGDHVSATVEAEGEVSTLSMTRAGILLLIDSSPIFRTHIIEEMVKRIQKSNDRVMEEHTKSLLIIKQNGTEDQHRYGELVGNSAQTKALIKEIDRLSKIEGIIYIQGESGVGKAHFARRIHYHSSSTAIPAVMRPVNYQGKTLVDGAVVHPVPVALVKGMGADIVIAVNVCDDSYMKGSAKNFISSILNTIDIMSAKIVKEELQLADVILRA